MEINWNNIRPINGSLHEGFEEFVCQLANKKKYPLQQNFIRVGKPDGGKECFWEFSNGDLYCWQAKYFTTSLSSVQWSQIEKSIKTTIDNHPNLKKYFVAIPIDMPDVKVNGRVSMLAKWDKLCRKWEMYAKGKGIILTFEYWGNHDLIKMISSPAFQGFNYFWFNQTEFTDDWFDWKNKESITALGNRYTPELNYQLEISDIFEGISQQPEFQKSLEKYLETIVNSFRPHVLGKTNNRLKDLINAITLALEDLKNLYSNIIFEENQKMPFLALNTICKNLLKLTGDIVTELYNLIEAKRKEKKELQSSSYYSRPYASELNSIYEFEDSINKAINYFNSAPCKLYNNPFLLITGDAGMGKSHLLADVIERRKSNNMLSLLLLGENFSTKELPWTQIINNQLRKAGIDEFIFLDALNAKAESIQSRIIIFIDAINEGEGRNIWPKSIKHFIETVKEYPWLGLVLTVRSSFERLITPVAVLTSDIITRTVHKGFYGVEYEAASKFFKHYNITQPHYPLLNPEFQNPLFLKLFCQSISEKGFKEIPQGYEGIVTIVDSFIDNINERLSSEAYLYYDEHKKLVQKAVYSIIQEMAVQNIDAISYEEADNIVDKIFSNNCAIKEPYLKRLISEGLFNVDLFWEENGKSYDVVFFAYQRFQDHITVSMLLNDYCDFGSSNYGDAVKKMEQLLSTNFVASENQNIIDALSIQIPERLNKELFELFPEKKEYSSIIDGFINSLIWRKHQTIGDSADNYVTDVILKDEYYVNYFFDIIISKTFSTTFSFNATYINFFLKNFSLAERDARWTTFLQNKYGEKSDSNSVRRLINWAWNDDDKSYIGDEEIYLTSVCLTWFLTSSNRYLRDSATKALICMLCGRQSLLIRLLKEFKTVNDPYVYERLYAVAYGITVRSFNKHHAKILCDYVYQTIFNQDIVYQHILLRDYARGIIEYALTKETTLEIDLKKIRPPYSSVMLPQKFPTNKLVDKLYAPKGNSGNYDGENWGSTAILNSMTTEYGRGIAGYGDFGRYTFQHAFDDWDIDYNGLSNYAVKLIFELGYNPLVFSKFDSEQGTGRINGHLERIGKKYQWIIFYELLARVSDQCVLKDESDWNSPKKAINFEGPWYPYVRDIDPTMIIRDTKHERYEAYSQHWWFNKNYSYWKDADEIWINKLDDLPQPEDIIQVFNENNCAWLWLEMQPTWSEPKSLRVEFKDTDRKSITYWVNSYIIDRTEFEKFKKEFSKSVKYNDLPDTRTMYTVFSREYYWSSAFNFFNKPYYDGRQPTEIYDKKNTYIGNAFRTAEYFLWEEEFDRSKNLAIQFYKPSHFLQKQLSLEFSTKEGEFVNEFGEMVCFDPSVNQKSISGLLIEKQTLVEWLNRENLSIFWIVLGEKNILSHNWRNKTYPSQVQFCGLYSMKDNDITGTLYRKPIKH
jgi:hypothetical protein